MISKIGIFILKKSFDVYGQNTWIKKNRVAENLTAQYSNFIFQKPNSKLCIKYKVIVFPISMDTLYMCNNEIRHMDLVKPVPNIQTI